jgi:hypothetical protein
VNVYFIDYRTQQDSSRPQPTANQPLKQSHGSSAQQDPSTLQLTLCMGLIANLTASAQQETIDHSVRRLHDLGREVLQQALGNTLLSLMLPSTPPNAP